MAARTKKPRSSSKASLSRIAPSAPSRKPASSRGPSTRRATPTSTRRAAAPSPARRAAPASRSAAPPSTRRATPAPTKQSPTPKRPATSPPRALSQERYRALLARIQDLLTAAESQTTASKLEAYWHVGESIHATRLSEEAGYHNAILRDLALDTGLTVRTLQQAVAFHTTYPRVPETGGLTWSHYRILTRFQDEKERAFYEDLARRESLSARELEGAIQSELYSTGPAEKPQLRRPTDPNYIYQARVLDVIDADTLEVDVDLGFHTSAKRKLRLAQINAPEIRTPAGRAAKTLLTERLLSARTLVVQTHKTDLHGRYVAHVFLSSHETTAADCFANGTHLNDLLVRRGHAKVVRG